MEKKMDMMPADSLAMERCDMIIKSTITLKHNGEKQNIYTLQPYGVNFEYLVRGLNVGFEESDAVEEAQHVIYSIRSRSVFTWYEPIRFERKKR